MPTKRISSRKEAAQVARDVIQLRESIKAAQSMERKYSQALRNWMINESQPELDAEGQPTAVLKDHISGYNWDMMRMPDDDLQMLRKLGLLTVRKGEYDEAVMKHGPLGLLQKWATPHYSLQLRFEPPALKEGTHAKRRGKAGDGELGVDGADQ